MSNNKKLPPKPKDNDHVGTKLLIIAFGLLIFSFVFFDAYVPTPGRQLIPLSLTGIIAGLTYENFRLNKKWINFLLMLVGSLILGFFFTIMPSKSHTYNFARHMEAWPYVFIFFFIIFSVAFHKQKLIPRLSEKITLVQSIAFIYLVTNKGYFHSGNLVLLSAISIGTGFSLFSCIHAFTHYHLSSNSRLLLSIWSSVVMLLFAINNVYGVYTSDPIEKLSDFSEKLYEWLAYFLLGISSMYMAKNLMMLANFLPAKGEFFNSEFFRRVRRTKKQHIERYSDEQANVRASIFWALFAGTVFTINYYVGLLPSHTAIWVVFVCAALFGENKLDEKLEDLNHDNKITKNE